MKSLIDLGIDIVILLLSAGIDPTIRWISGFGRSAYGCVFNPSTQHIREIVVLTYAQTKKAANPFELAANPFCGPSSFSEKYITAQLHRTLHFG